MLGSESITLAFVHTRPWTGRDAGRSSSRSCRRQLAPHPEGLTLGLCLLGPGPCSKRRPDAGPGRLSEGRQGFLCASCLNSRRSAGEQGEEARWHGSHCSEEARGPSGAGEIRALGARTPGSLDFHQLHRELLRQRLVRRVGSFAPGRWQQEAWAWAPGCPVHILPPSVTLEWRKARLLGGRTGGARGLGLTTGTLDTWLSGPAIIYKLLQRPSG